MVSAVRDCYYRAIGKLFKLYYIRINKDYFLHRYISSADTEIRDTTGYGTDRTVPYRTVLDHTVPVYTWTRDAENLGLKSQTPGFPGISRNLGFPRTTPEPQLGCVRDSTASLRGNI